MEDTHSYRGAVTELHRIFWFRRILATDSISVDKWTFKFI